VLDKLLDDPSKLSVAVLLLAAVTAFVRAWIVPGASHTRALAERDAQIAKLTLERDEFKQMLYTSLSVAERSQRVRGASFLGAKDAR